MGLAESHCVRASVLDARESATPGSVTVINATGFVLNGDPAEVCAENTIGGSLIVESNHHGVQVIGNHVTGAVVAGTGTGPYPGNTTATATATVSGNGHPLPTRLDTCA